MAKKNKLMLPAWALFLIAAAMLTAGWLMRSLPIFIFAGLAPLFGVAGRGKGDDDMWGYSEFILMALTVSLLAAHLFDIAYLVAAISQAIILTLAFLAYSYAHQSLGLGKFTIIIFWLGVEYLFLKLPVRGAVVFLADALQFKPEWLRWNSATGYLGASCWILVCNFLFYVAFLKEDQQLRGVFLVLALIVLAGPIILSYWSENDALKRGDMMMLYQHENKSPAAQYFQRGEVIPRTSAIVSALTLLLALAKNKI